MNFRKSIPLCFIVMFAITSCGKKNTPSPLATKAPPVVYITGICRSGANSQSLAVYWRNGVRTALADSTGNNSSMATGIVVSGTDVYISGTLNSNAVYWKNGKAITIASGFGSYGNAIAVNGNDVYVAGYEIDQPVYWKNGAEVILNADGAGVFGDAIAVSGNDVYVAGNFFTSGSQQIGYWKNGVITNVANSPSDYATYYLNTYFQGWLNIAVSGSNVYLTGATPGFLTATYWKNGTPVYQLDHPTQQSVLNNITLSGSDVYVAGFYDVSAAYWKNGTMTTLSNGAQVSSMATAIAIDGSDVYVAGLGGANPTVSALCWKNGVLTTLPGNTSATTGIALVQQ